MYGYWCFSFDTCIPYMFRQILEYMPNIFCTALLPTFYPVDRQYSGCKHVLSIREENSVNPYQMALLNAS